MSSMAFSISTGPLPVTRVSTGQHVLLIAFTPFQARPNHAMFGSWRKEWLGYHFTHRTLLETFLGSANAGISHAMSRSRWILLFLSIHAGCTRSLVSYSRSKAKDFGWSVMIVRLLTFLETLTDQTWTGLSGPSIGLLSFTHALFAILVSLVKTLWWAGSTGNFKCQGSTWKDRARVVLRLAIRNTGRHGRIQFDRERCTTH